ncbi:MAG: Glycosyl transferase family 2, partial [Candidatus Woesebacteria bacterium GW2011_GWA1_39_12]
MAKEGGRRFLSGQIWEGELACKVDRRMEISAIIIAINEEKKISDCLESLSWVDEILVIDGGSKDKTVSISKKYGARVVDYREG